MTEDQNGISLSSRSSRTVGRAIHEVALTDALARHSAWLLPPGPGRSVVVIPEVSIGRGRPDVLIVVVSMTALNAYLASGLGIETRQQARAIVTNASMASSGTLLARSRWTRATVRQYSSAVFDSLAVEAKMKDWKQAIRQASRFRHLANRAAIMLPDNLLINRIEPYLQTYGLGLITFGDGRPVWRVPASKNVLEPINSLWILELVAREIRTKSPRRP